MLLCSRFLTLFLFLISAVFCDAEVFQLPTANDAIFADGGGERFYVGTVGKAWTSGTFGCVRSNGRQLHEGLDIKPLQRDARGEATDPILATGDGTVVYVNRRAALSNYGIYVVLRHLVENLEVYSLYAHLKSVADTVQPGKAVRKGEVIGVMGRTANTREGIDKSRAHLHFELNLFVNDRFPAWQAKEYPGQRNDHGQWNGQNLLGFDPAEVFLRQRKEGEKFSLLRMLQHSREMFRVIVRDTHFPWLQRYRSLVQDNVLAQKEGVAGYELVMNYTGIPFQVIPRAASEVKAVSKYQLISVDPEEAKRNPARGLVRNHRGRWELSPNGVRHLNLLTF